MKAYIFDLDGTLLDSMGIWGKIDIEFLKKRGLKVPADYTEAIAPLSFSECAAYTIERFSLPDSIDGLVQEWNAMAAYAYAHTVQLKPHAKEYLAALKESGAKLAIATSSMPALYEPALRNHGIFEWFSVICRADEAGGGKASPAIFQMAAARLGVRPGDCLVFEDILAAVISAKNTGMAVCGVYDETARKDWPRIKAIADYAICDFSQAPLPQRPT
jgi:HAD superfamily hydrolase (TIGR01509 family)